MAVLTDEQISLILSAVAATNLRTIDGFDKVWLKPENYDPYIKYALSIRPWLGLGRDLGYYSHTPTQILRHLERLGLA